MTHSGFCTRGGGGGGLGWGGVLFMNDVPQTAPPPPQPRPAVSASSPEFGAINNARQPAYVRHLLLTHSVTHSQFT